MAYNTPASKPSMQVQMALLQAPEESLQRLTTVTKGALHVILEALEVQGKLLTELIGMIIAACSRVLPPALASCTRLLTSCLLVG